MKTLGERLRWAREQKGWSQERLAAESGVKQGSISKIERGDQERTTFAVVLADTLGVDVAWLESGRAAERAESLSHEERALLAAYRGADDAHRELARRALEVSPRRAAPAALGPTLGERPTKALSDVVTQGEGAPPAGAERQDAKQA